MSKLKKALSLLLAAAMVLGMMLVPTGAASTFADEDQITYPEEVAITAGLGLFAGADGKFMPKDTVTRAQMATIIVKMLHGADANADAFKGVSGGFTDTAKFEGGWAEGYINWCASLGIVKGYGDGTFKPGNKVTAAEAVTMILNALKIDAGEGTWPVTVMAKAEEVKFFADLNTKPASDKALSREELAVVSLAGLEYSPEGKTGYMYDGKVF
ncbi:MAG: S-layer homology domain-containing protein, partial [Oscillospiraceae bacterium]|nr:S-layer homology domain-containing protein [Oscillospiraceae bacterium]